MKCKLLLGLRFKGNRTNKGKEILPKILSKMERDIHRKRSAIDRWLRDRPIVALTMDPSNAQRDRSIAQIRRSRPTYI